MKARRRVPVILLPAVLFLVAGCSAFRPEKQTLTVTCTPPDAIVMINGQRYESPVSIKVKRNRSVSIECYKEGYVPYDRMIGTHMNITGTLDTLGASFLFVPSIGLFYPGAWSLDETEVPVTLFQK